MTPGGISWRKAANGDLLAAMDGLKLVVRLSDGFARYLLLGPPTRGGGEIMLESGSAPDISAAKAKAVRRAQTVSWLRRRKAAQAA